MIATLRPLALAAAFLAIPATARSVSADLVFYTDEASFVAAAPTLSDQTFGSATIPPIGLAIVGNPLDQFTNNGVFSAGSILAGLSITSSNEHAGQDLGVVSPGIFGNTATAVYNNFADDSLNLAFGPSATAVGMGLLNPSGTSIVVGVYSPAGLLIGSETVTVPSAGPDTFYGVIGTNGTQIGSISLLGQGTHAFAGVDRLSIAFQSVPEPGSLLLVSLGAIGLLVPRAIRHQARKVR